MLPGCPTTLQSGDKNTCLAFHRGRYSRSRIASADDLAEKEQYLLRCFGFNLPPSHPIPENGVGPPRALSAACAADLGVNDFRPRTPVSGVKEPVGRLCSVICWLEWKPMPGEEALSSLFDIEPAGMPGRRLYWPPIAEHAQPPARLRAHTRDQHRRTVTTKGRIREVAKRVPPLVRAVRTRTRRDGQGQATRETGFPAIVGLDREVPGPAPTLVTLRRPSRSGLAALRGQHKGAARRARRTNARVSCT